MALSGPGLVLDSVVESKASRENGDLMTDVELKELVAGLAVRQTDADRRFERTERLLEEAAEERRNTERMLQATDRQIKELGRQIGGLGEKFGGFTEGMAYPSMQKILRQRFGVDAIFLRATSRNNGRTMELEVLAYSHSEDKPVYIVEVKSHLREDGLQQMLQTLRDFRGFFPEHEDRKVYGILAAVDIPEKLRERVLEKGIYLARIHDDVFEVQVPEGFQPRAF
jgi:hypothetical protein